MDFSLVISLLILVGVVVLIYKNQQERQQFITALRQEIAARGGRYVDVVHITPWGARGFLKYRVSYEWQGQRVEHVVLNERGFWGKTTAVYWDPPLPPGL